MKGKIWKLKEDRNKSGYKKRWTQKVLQEQRKERWKITYAAHHLVFVAI